MPTSDSIHVAKFKAKAKSLHRAVKSGDPAALDRIHPYFSNQADFKLSNAQLVIARELHAESWRELTRREDWEKCSFCKKWQYDLQKLIAGPDRVFVCDECVALCNEIIREGTVTAP